MTKSRLEAFSDGVIAVIITIMVLEIKVPQGIDAMVLAPVVPVFLTYVVSFVFVGIYWNNHHHLFHAVHHVNGATLRANLHLLFWLALAPFVTGWAGTSHFATLPVPHTARSYSERPARTTSSLASCSGRTARTHCRRGHSGGTLKGGSRWPSMSRLLSSPSSNHWSPVLCTFSSQRFGFVRIHASRSCSVGSAERWPTVAAVLMHPETVRREDARA